MKKIILFLIVLISIYSFQNNQENKVLGIWKMETFIIYNDTIFHEKDEFYTINYFKKSIAANDTSSDTKVRNEITFRNKFDSFKTNRFAITSKYLNSYKIDSLGKKIKIHSNISYRMIDNKVVIKQRDKEKFNLDFDIEYDITNDKLIIIQADDKLKVLNSYIRTNK